MKLPLLLAALLLAPFTGLHPAKIQLPAAFLPQHPFDNGEMTVRDEKLAPWPHTQEDSKQQLALAEGAGLNCLRVVLPFVVWEHDAAAFKMRLGEFLAVCDRRGLRVMPALFDDCAFGSDVALRNPYYGKQPEVIEGFYANGWTPSPGHDMVRDPGTWPRLESYVKDIISTFRDDRRV